MTNVLVSEPTGADLGNDSLKIVFDSKTMISIKNTVSRQLLDEVAPHSLSDDEVEYDKLDRLDVIISKNGGPEQRFFVGNYAIEVGEDEKVVGTGKADNEDIHIPMLAVMAHRMPKNRKKVNHPVVCGLPLKQFSPENRQKMQERLIGNYVITIMENGRRSRTVEILIDQVMVAPEGVPVLANQMFNADATDFARPELRQGSYAVADIGAFTTDIPVLENGKPNSRASDGLAEGISTYIDKIASRMSEITGATISRNQILKKILSGDYEVLKVRGKSFQLASEVDSQLNFFAKRIVDTIKVIWDRNYEIEQFFVVGGGSKLLRKYLDKHAKAVGIDLTFIEPKNTKDVQNEPQAQNAFGYWKLASQKFGA